MRDVIGMIGARLSDPLAAHIDHLVVSPSNMDALSRTHDVTYCHHRRSRNVLVNGAKVWENAFSPDSSVGVVWKVTKETRYKFPFLKG